MDTRLAQFGCGINLGNSLDSFKDGATDTETCWGNPRTTREMVQMFAKDGFDILRLPVTWGAHMDTEGTVNPQWMARVREVVDWSLDAGMKVILNVHHDNPWLHPELSTLCDVLPRYRRLWQQIATKFAAYGDELLFQGTNEPNLINGENCNEGSGNRNVRAAINAINHTFVRTVREMGGNNATRWLCVPGLAARPLPDCLRDLILPKDDRLILTIHSYVPDRFVFSRGNQHDTAFFDEKARDELREMFSDIKCYAVPHGLPIMITEFGAVAKLLPDHQTHNDGERARFVEEYMQCANEMGIPCVWWDNNYFDNGGDEYFGIYDRATLTCHSPAVVEAIQNMARKRGKA
jgi:endoglucanase